MQALQNCLKQGRKNYRRNPFNRNLQQILYGARKQFKRVCKTSESSFRSKLTEKLLSIEEKEPKEFWNLIKKMQNWGKPNEDPSSCIKPDEWMSHFQSLLTESYDVPTNKIDELGRLENEPSFTELDSRITVSEIEKAIQKLNKKAAPGPDNITAEHMIAGKSALMPLFVLIFNKVFTNAEYPQLWTNNYLKPIFEKGDSSGLPLHCYWLGWFAKSFSW